MPRKEITKLIEELRSWLPNYNHGPEDFPTVLYRTLAALPGGDELEDMGYQPIGNLGWKEAELLGQTLEAIQDKRDVQDLVRGLMNEEETEEARELQENRNEYIIKITGAPRVSGEYSGGSTIEAARKEASTFRPLPNGARMRIVRYDRDGERITFSEDVPLNETSVRELRGRRRPTEGSKRRRTR